MPGQQGMVEHVRVRQDQCGVLAGPPAVVRRGVAVVDRGAHAGDRERLEGGELVGGESLGRRQVERGRVAPTGRPRSLPPPTTTRATDRPGTFPTPSRWRSRHGVRPSARLRGLHLVAPRRSDAGVPQRRDDVGLRPTTATGRPVRPGAATSGHGAAARRVRARRPACGPAPAGRAPPGPPPSASPVCRCHTAARGSPSPSGTVHRLHDQFRGPRHDRLPSRHDLGGRSTISAVTSTDRSGTPRRRTSPGCSPVRTTWPSILPVSPPAPTGQEVAVA